MKRASNEINRYIPATIDMCSIENPISIKIPNNAVPMAVEKTISAVVSAFIEPMYLTPYISAHMEDPKTFAKPFEIPIRLKKINEITGLLK